MGGGESASIFFVYGNDMEIATLTSAIVIHPIDVFFCPVEVFVHVIAEHSVNVDIVAK